MVIFNSYVSHYQRVLPWFFSPFRHLWEALQLPCQVRHVDGQAQAPMFHEATEAQSFSQAKGTLPDMATVRKSHGHAMDWNH